MCNESKLSEVKECPNCGGSGKAGLLWLINGKRKIATCYMCTGGGTVPAWDWDRLNKLVAGQTMIDQQMELQLASA